MIKLVVFDLWQTLAYRAVNYGSTEAILAMLPVPIPPADFVKIFEASVQTQRWASKYEAYANLCRNMGVPVTAENVNRLVAMRDQAEAQPQLFPHTLPMLRQLRAQGYKIGLLSNSSVFAVEQVKARTDLLNYIDYPLFSFEVGVIKPQLAFFQKMLTIAGCLPAEAVMIGDKLGDDVWPPRQLGMHSIHYTDYETLKTALAELGIKLN